MFKICLSYIDCCILTKTSMLCYVMVYYMVQVIELNLGCCRNLSRPRMFCPFLHSWLRVKKPTCLFVQRSKIHSHVVCQDQSFLPPDVIWCTWTVVLWWDLHYMHVNASTVLKFTKQYNVGIAEEKNTGMVQEGIV